MDDTKSKPSRGPRTLDDNDASSRAVNGSKCCALVEGVDNQGGRAWVGAAGGWDVLMRFSKCCCEPRLRLKRSVQGIFNSKYKNIFHNVSYCPEMRLRTILI